MNPYIRPNPDLHFSNNQQKKKYLKNYAEIIQQGLYVNDEPIFYLPSFSKKK